MLVFKSRPRRDPAHRAELTNSEKRVMRLLRNARQAVIDDVKSRQGEFLNAIMHQSAQKVAGMVTTEPWVELSEELQNEFLQEVISGGRRVQLPSIQKATISFRFDAERPEAARWAAKNAGQLIQGITQDQSLFVQELISQAELGGYTPAQAARTLREMENGLGLTTQQSDWVANFESRRITDLMDQGFGYEAAVARAERPTARYADRIYRYRTETIARTEILRASNEGRNEAWQQGIDEGFINPNQEKEWSVNIDDRTCDICFPLNGERVLVNEDFPWGDPPRHPNCRCTVLLTDDIPQDLASMSDAEIDAEIDRLLQGDPSSPRTAEGPIRTPEQEQVRQAIRDAGYDPDEIEDQFTNARSGKDAYSQMYQQQEEEWRMTYDEGFGDRDPYDAVVAWGGSDYTGVNDALSGNGSRGDSLPSGMTVGRFIDKMDTAFEYAPPLREATIVRRMTSSRHENIGELVRSDAGSIFESPQYMATTMQPLDDLRLSGFGGNVEMDILLPRGSSAVNVDAVTYSGTREYEMLLDRDSSYILASQPTQTEEGRWKIQLLKIR